MSRRVEGLLEAGGGNTTEYLVGVLLMLATTCDDIKEFYDIRGLLQLQCH